jgi:four helix bundle protein
MRYQEWETTVPDVIKADSVWRSKAYQLGLFAADLAWQDVTKLHADNRTRSLSDQLYQAIGSISANIAEGYSRGSSRERAHCYEYALGSAREARDWYYKGRHILPEQVIDHRLNLLTETVRLLLAMIPEQRGQSIREESPAYDANAVQD